MMCPAPPRLSAEPAAWKPYHRSPLAGLVWRAFASGTACGWSEGKIVHPAPSEEDGPWLPDFRDWHGGLSPPDWISALLARLDSLLPPAEDILPLMDADSLTLETDPAAFRMPACPCPIEAGACAAAARALLACRDDLVVPAFVDPAEAGVRIEHASCMALMLGGEAAFLSATGMLSDPATYVQNPEPEDLPPIAVEEEGG